MISLARRGSENPLVVPPCPRGDDDANTVLQRKQQAQKPAPTSDSGFLPCDVFL